MPRRESVGRRNAAIQPASGPPTMQMVSVAVLPPRLPPGVAPPTGLGVADAFNWDESLNWQHNLPVPKEGEEPRKKSIWNKAGLTTKRERRGNSDTPNFVLRQIPYETWRKHYAKDKDGNYKGTHAPAEDCLLKPDDVQKWNLNAGQPTTLADKWTRGREVLPGYGEVKEEGMVPGYEGDYDAANYDDGAAQKEAQSQQNTYGSSREDGELQNGDQPPRYDGPPPEEPVVGAEAGTVSPQRLRSIPEQSSRPHKQVNRKPVQTINGKTPDEIIREAKANPPPKMGFKELMQRGAEWASFGG
jgi:hypothetical protein